MTAPELVFDGHDRGRVGISVDAVDGTDAGLRLRFAQRSARVEVADRVDTGLLDDLWTLLGAPPGSAVDHCHLVGRAGRIDLTLRLTEDSAGLRAMLRPASGVRVDLELEIAPQRDAWRAVLAAWLRDRAATDLELPGL